MAILNATPPTKTPEERLQSRANSHMSRLDNQYRQIIATAKDLAEFIWQNSAGTPQEMFDLFGKDAAELLKISAAYKAMMKVYTGTEPAIMPPGYDVKINEDGTVTVEKTA